MVGPEGLVCIYAPIGRNERAKFFEYLVHFIGKWEGQNYVICSDFNALISSEEWWGVNGFGASS